MHLFSFCVIIHFGFYYFQLAHDDDDDDDNDKILIDQLVTIIIWYDCTLHHVSFIGLNTILSFVVLIHGIHIYQLMKINSIMNH